MFKISTKGDYGLLLLSYLAEALNKGKKFVSLKEIADSKKLSPRYLSQIVLCLKRAGLVKSKEGREGGYCLAKKPSQITIMKILELLEGPVEPVRCCGIKNAECGRESYCNVKSTWTEAKWMLINFLKNKTLQDLIN